MIEKLGRGELAIISNDAAGGVSAVSAAVPQHVVHYHAPPSPTQTDDSPEASAPEKPTLLRLLSTGLCAIIILWSLVYIADKLIAITTGVLDSTPDTSDITTPLTGDTVAGYEVSDEYGIRPFHPVTGAPNVPHNGVDLAMPVGTPIYAVGDAGDRVEVECWWDVDGGGWVVNQTAESYAGHVFQSLHMSETGCKEGTAMAGEAIAYSGNSGLGTGAHYDFRVKIDGTYVPPDTKYLESAVTGDPPKN